ncbi:MAG: hypothetical protein ACPGXK_16555 [Phycisphaerae bacterium]
MANENTPEDAIKLFCPECDYDLTGAPGDRCPWCGWDIDVDLLVANARGRTPATKLGVIVTATFCAVASIMGAYQVVQRVRDLELPTALLAAGLIIGAIGHFALAGRSFFSGSRWPMRPGQLSAMLLLVAALSISGGIYGATDAIETQQAPRVVRGVKVSGFVEFTLASLLFTSSGWTLLLLRLTSFGELPRSTVDARPLAPQSSNAQSAPFVVDVCGRFLPHELRATKVTAARQRHPVLEAEIGRIWEAEMAEADIRGIRLFNGELARLAGWKSSQAALHLELGMTCYRDFIGTNLRQASRTASLGESHLSNALGVSVIPVTRDGFAVLGRRSNQVASFPGYIHMIGGMVERQDENRDESYDLFGSIMREMNEELGLRTSEYEDVKVIGLVRDLAIMQPELIFEAMLALSRDELLARFEEPPADPTDGNDKDEHDQLIFVGDDNEAFSNFLVNANRVSAVTQAGMLLHGRHDWGHDWYETTCLLTFGQIPAFTR